MVLALLLLSIGVADLIRSNLWPRGQRTKGSREWQREAIALLGAIVVCVAVTLLTSLDWRWTAGVAVLTSAWVASTRTIGSRWKPTIAPVVALALVTVAYLGLAVQLPRADGLATDWYNQLEIAALKSVPFDKFALTVGGIVFLIESANLVVRLILTKSGIEEARNKRRFKGGRTIGPIERVFVLSMVLIGEYLAISAVIAAKGILRFPELAGRNRGHHEKHDDDDDGRHEQHQEDDEDGVDRHEDEAEYVLVGSLVSWSIAFIGAALIWLA